MSNKIYDLSMYANYYLIRTVCLKVNGSQSDKDERFKAAQYVMQLKVSQFMSSFVYVVIVIFIVIIIIATWC